MSASDVTERRRGWTSLYALSFGLLLAAGVVLTVAALPPISLRLLRVSAVLSIGAIVVAAVSVVLPRRS